MNNYLEALDRISLCFGATGKKCGGGGNHPSLVGQGLKHNGTTRMISEPKRLTIPGVLKHGIRLLRSIVLVLTYLSQNSQLELMELTHT